MSKRIGLTLFAVIALIWAAPPAFPHEASKEEHSHKPTASTPVYVCPMHPEVRSDKPGKCPKCGMALVQTQLGPPPAGSASSFKGEFTTEPRTVKAGEPMTMSISLSDKTTGQKVTGFETVHEKLIHLVIVSRDLSFFEHVHPDDSPDGTFKKQMTFTQGGEYKFYADVTPKGRGQQILTETLKVDGPGQSVVPLVPDRDLSKTVEGIAVTLALDPPVLKSGAAMLTFSMKDAKTGKPVADRSPYLGAFGHCIIISEDTTEFLHAHPQEAGEMLGEHAHGERKSGDSGGPDVAFHTSFPKSGLYKVWGQFNRMGNILTIPFVLQVR